MLKSKKEGQDRIKYAHKIKRDIALLSKLKEKNNVGQEVLDAQFNSL